MCLRLGRERSVVQLESVGNPEMSLCKCPKHKTCLKAIWGLP